MDILQISNLNKIFIRWGQKIHALKDISLNVQKGEFILLTGPNGSGKSTLFNVISGRIQDYTGTVLINGKSNKKTSQIYISQEVFQVHQDPLLGTASNMTIFENIYVSDLKAQNSKLNKHSLMEKYLGLLNPLCLGDRIHQPVYTLSGGERQLLALVIARLRPCNLILLDEPFNALDPKKFNMSVNEIHTINKTGKTIIIITHQLSLVNSMKARVIKIDQGKIVSNI